MSATAPQRCCTLCFLGGLLLLGCSGARQESHAAVNAERNVTAETLYSLNATQMSVVQPMGSDLREPEKQKFVQFELSKISNSSKQPISFEVHFQAENGEKFFLDTFSPFPADNTGRFLVATKGRLQSHGAIVLSMVLLDGTKPAADLNVQVKKFTFREK